MKSFIFIPFVHALDLLEKAVKSLDYNLHERYIIFNQSGSTLPNFITAKSPFEVINHERISFINVQNYFQKFATQILKGF